MSVNNEDRTPDASRERKRRLAPKRGSELVRLINGEDLSTGLERKYQARYLEVLMAAANQFAERGYQATTTGDIAAELGIKQSGLYYYINSKESALEQICEVAIDGYVSCSRRIIDSDASASSKLRALIRAHLATLEDRATFFKVFQENRKDLADAARHRIGRQIRAYEAHVEQVFRQGVESGEFRADLDPRQAMLTLLTACNGVSVWLGARLDADIDTIGQHIGDLILHGAAGSSKAINQPRPVDSGLQSSGREETP